MTAVDQNIQLPANNQKIHRPEETVPAITTIIAVVFFDKNDV